MSLQKEVSAGVLLVAVLHAVLHVNSKALTFAEGGWRVEDVLDMGTSINIMARARITSPSIIITTTEIGKPCAFISKNANDNIKP